MKNVHYEKTIQGFKIFLHQDIHLMGLSFGLPAKPLKYPHTGVPGFKYCL